MNDDVRDLVLSRLTFIHLYVLFYSLMESI